MTIKAISALAAIIATGSIACAAQAQGIDYAKTSFTAQKLGPNVYVLTGSPDTDPIHPEGAGGRIGLLVGPDGVLMVDSSYAPLSDKVLAAIRKLSPAPIRYVVNTHLHGDHVGGNPAFAKMGAVMLASEETWRRKASGAHPRAIQGAPKC
ncbi:MBL fold metallo-hydrolase [Bradyrhizobium prioriisuperbiae]|uniref:MBL fold metallo-hydrolase n=1 Tax=Bradyrhizobium prioriisuperbiae TaxID=2854389 RepID=UPI0028E456ED|nr:MBL fold metallo-hydrolase [Bradyrhizobium prioritasuperba]